MLSVSAALAQTAAPRSSAPTKSKSYSPPRTAWGDPDLQGSYNNTDESGTPFERPAEFEGKRVEDVSAAELAKAIQQRNDRKAQLAPTLGGRETHLTKDESKPVFEYACHEGNYGMSNILSAARAQEAKPAKPAVPAGK